MNSNSKLQHFLPHSLMAVAVAVALVIFIVPFGESSARTGDTMRASAGMLLSGPEGAGKGVAVGACASGCPCGCTGLADHDGNGAADCDQCVAACAQPPQNLQARCTNGTAIELSWDPSANTAHYSLVLNDTANGWSGSCSSPLAGDYCNIPHYGTTYNGPGIMGHSYTWAVWACASSQPDSCMPVGGVGGAQFACVPPVTAATCDTTPDPQYVDRPVLWQVTSVTGGGGLHTCSWSGDVTGGGTNADCSKSVTYSTPGIKIATVTVQGGGGGTGSAQNTCQVEVRRPQCSDGVDNDDEDTLEDADDPGCHTDNDASDGDSTHDPDDDDESSTSMPGYVNIDAAPTLIESGGSSDLDWEASNVNPSTCSVTSSVAGMGPWNVVPPSGVVNASNLTTTTAFTLTCLDVDNDPVTDQAVVRVNPSLKEK